MKQSEHKFQLNMRQLSTVLTVLYVVCLIPLLVIAKYDFPSYDDYSMALETHLTWEDTGSVAATLAACLSETVDLYLTWTGYFTSSLLTSISPASFGIRYYWLGAVFVFAVLHAGVIALMYAVMERMLGADRYVRRIATVIALFLMIQLMPTGELGGNPRVECFYWYSGAGNYTATFALMLLYLSCLLLAVYAKTAGHRRLLLVLACVFGFFAGGGNYMSALTCAIVTFLAGILLAANCTGRMRRWIEAETNSQEQMSRHVLLREEWRRSLLVPMLFMYAGFFISVLAPGNLVRSEQTSGFGAVKSILISLYYTLDYTLDEWLSWAVIVVFAVLGIVFWESMRRNPKENGTLTFRHPVVVSLLGYGLVSANATPLLYALGGMGGGRNKGLFWMQFILIMVWVEYYLVGWLRNVLQRDVLHGEKGTVRSEPELLAFPADAGGQDLSRHAVRMIAFLSGLFIAGSAMCVKVDPHYYTFTSAVTDLVNGTAEAFAEENEERLAILEDPEITDAVIKIHSAQPALLFYRDVEDTFNGWDNFTMTRYFRKNSVLGEY